MTLNNKNRRAISATNGFHTIRINHEAFIAVKRANVDDFKDGVYKTIGETATRLILAGVK